MKKRHLFQLLMERLQEPRKFMQVLPGMEAFTKLFRPAKALLVGEQGISLEDFLKMPVTRLIY